MRGDVSQLALLALSGFNRINYRPEQWLLQFHLTFTAEAMKL
jgi:hypothetical protein